jgi:hypothetical protein
MLRPSAGTSYAFTDAASLIEVLQTVPPDRVPEP